LNRISKLTEEVSALYLTKNPKRADWADWLFENHIFVVAKKAGELADRFGAKKELCEAAALLHDIADTVMRREDERHDVESESIARMLLEKTGFSAQEITIIVDDAIHFHSCKNGKLPQTLEGKIMATADALAQLQTNFFEFALETFQQYKSRDDIKKWALSKIERDFRVKIFFVEVQDQVIKDYEKAKSVFTSC
jgi:putative nucleotidyltransferase with HDIG domain